MQLHYISHEYGVRFHLPLPCEICYRILNLKGLFDCKILTNALRESNLGLCLRWFQIQSWVMSLSFSSQNWQIQFYVLQRRLIQSMKSVKQQIKLCLKLKELFYLSLNSFKIFRI